MFRSVLHCAHTNACSRRGGTWSCLPAGWPHSDAVFFCFICLLLATRAFFVALFLDLPLGRSRIELTPQGSRHCRSVAGPACFPEAAEPPRSQPGFQDG